MRRVGLIIPSSNVVIEDTLRHHADRLSPMVALHIARFSVVSVDLASHSTDQFRDEPIDAALDQLREAEVEQIVFAGTAGAWLGIKHERVWQRRACQRVGVDVTSTTLLTIDALRAAQVDRLALITPFKIGIHQQIVENLRGEGFSVSGGRNLGLELSRDMAEISPSVIAEQIKVCLDKGCETVLCFCTNFRGLDACANMTTENSSTTLLDSVGLTLQAIGAFDC